MIAEKYIFFVCFLGALRGGAVIKGNKLQSFTNWWYTHI